MSKHNKANGSRYEREFVQQCQDFGLVAQRVPLSGAMAGYPGDVIVSDEIVIECKYRKNGTGFKRLYDLVVHECNFFQVVEVAGLRAVTMDRWLCEESYRVDGIQTTELEVVRPEWKTKFAFIHSAFDQGECAADYVACRMQTPKGQPRLPWMVVSRIGEVSDDT